MLFSPGLPSDQPHCQFGFCFLFFSEKQHCVVLHTRNQMTFTISLISSPMKKRVFQEWILFIFCWQISKQEIVLQRGFLCCLKRITSFSFKFSLFQQTQGSQKQSCKNAECSFYHKTCKPASNSKPLFSHIIPQRQ